MNNWTQYKGVSGVYAIENTVNGKVYIGQSRNVYGRWLKHRGQLRKGAHDNRHLQRAWDKDGEAAFVFVFLDAADITALTSKEQEWMDEFSAVADGYNIQSVAGGSFTGRVWSEEAKKRLSEAVKAALSSPEVRSKRSAILVESWKDQDARSNRLRGIQRYSETPGVSEFRSAVAQRSCSRPSVKIRMSAASKKRLRGKSKLTEELVAQIRSRFVCHCPVNGNAALAKEFGVSTALISMIVHRKIWV